MSEIKFRAWDTISKRCLDTDEFLYIDGDFLSYDKYHQELGGIITDYVKVMQYTGLKDKNGVEIYEGDIVHLDNGTRNPYQVIWDDSFSGWAFGKTAGLNSLFSLYGAGVFEVIGNIYENPELLEANQR